MDMRESNERFRGKMTRRAQAGRLDDMSNAQIRKELYRICERFVMDNEISCPESIYQMDGVIGNAYEFIEEICNVIGYASVKEEGAEDDSLL